MKKNTFRKEERLCNQRSIDDLFHKGSSFVFYPFRVIFISPEDSKGTEKQMALELQTGPVKQMAQVLISVSKRRLKKASDRNLVKRRIREAYRLQKSTILEPYFQKEHRPVHFAIQYLPNEVLDYAFIAAKMPLILYRLIKEYAKVYLGETD